VLDLIGKLYLVEKEAREQGMEAAGRLAWRQQQKVGAHLQNIKERIIEIR
jgi:hypothetical protein